MKPQYIDYLYNDNVNITSQTGTFDRKTGTFTSGVSFSLSDITIKYNNGTTVESVNVQFDIYNPNRFYGTFTVTSNTSQQTITIGYGSFSIYTLSFKFPAGVLIKNVTYTIQGIYESPDHTRTRYFRNMTLVHANQFHVWSECHGQIAAFIDTADVARPDLDIYFYRHYFPSKEDGKRTDHYVLRYVKDPGAYSGDFARTPDCIVTSIAQQGETPPQWDGYVAIPLKTNHQNYSENQAVEYADLTFNYSVIGKPIADFQRQITYKNHVGKIFSTLSDHVYANSSVPIRHQIDPTEPSTYVIVYNTAIQSINQEAFYSADSNNRTEQITEIILPETITVIEASAFRNCSSLVSINIIDNDSNISYNTLPNYVTTICPHTFHGCSSLNTITIPNRVVDIQEYAFSGCKSLTTMSFATISPYLKSIGNYAFNGTSYLRTISFPSSLTDIGNWSFANSGLFELAIPVNIKNVGQSAFASCNSLQSVTYNLNTNGKTSLQTISAYCFASCSNMIYINSGTNSNTIPEGITTIGNYAFRNTSIGNITIPTTLKSAGLNLFAGNEKLTSATWNAINCNGFTTSTTSPFYANRNNIIEFIFGNQVQRIPSNMCYGMGIETITIPNSVTEIGNAAFKNCNYISTASFVLNSNNKVNITTIPQDCFSGDSALVNINTISGKNNIPKGVKDIKINAFKDTSLANITIPETLQMSDPSIFAGNSKLDSVQWNAINCKDFNSSIAGPFYANRQQIKNFTFGNTVKHIPSYLCYYMDNDSHTQAIIPSGCETIGNGAFYHNTKLSYVQLGTSNISTLASADMDVSIKTIGERAFGICANVNTCLIPYNITSIGALSFQSLGQRTNNGTTLYYRVYDTSIEEYWIEDEESQSVFMPFYNSKIYKAVFADGAAFIPSNLLSDAYSVQQIHVSRSVIEIGKNIFNKNWLKTVVFQSGTRILDNNVFRVDSYNDTSALKICFPSSLAYIGEGAFENRKNLNIIELSFGLRAINEDAFVGCNDTLDCYCLPIEPPYLYHREFDKHNPFDGYGKNGKTLKLHIPVTNQNWYKNADIWKYGPFVNNMQTLQVVTKSNKEGNNLYYYLMDRHVYATTNVISREALATFNPSKYDNPVVISGNEVTTNPSYNINSDLQAVTNTGNLIIPRTIDDNGITYTITEIGEEAFRGCNNIVNLYLPTSIKYIGPKAFWGCSNLTAIYFYNNNYTTINDIVLLDSDDSELTTIDRRAFKDCVKLKTMGNKNTFKLPNTVTTIEELSFSCCYRISDIIIGDRLFNIPINAFELCGSVISMTISPRNHDYSCNNTQGAVSLYNKDKSKLIKVFDKIISYTYTVHSGVTIGCQAFTWCRNMKKLVVSDGVEISEINGLFYECTGLEEIEWNVKDCISLRNSYGSPNDKGCFRCTKVEDPPTTNTGNYSFIKNYSKSKDNHYPGYTDLNLRYKMNPIRHYNYDIFDYNEKIKKFSFGANVERIPNFACYQLDLSGMDLLGNYYTITAANNNITEIGVSAFEQCTFKNNYNTGKYYLHCEKVEKIYQSAFEQSSIQGIVLGTALKTISQNAFNSLTSYQKQLHIKYMGTLEQWNNVTKESGWKIGITVYLETSDTTSHII